MLPATIFAHVDHIHQGHDRHRSEFAVPSAVYPGHEITVRRLDESARPVTKSDIHLLMHTKAAPGNSVIVKNYSAKPTTKFVVYMSSSPVQKDVPPPKAATPTVKDDFILLRPQSPGGSVILRSRSPSRSPLG